MKKRIIIATFLLATFILHYFVLNLFLLGMQLYAKHEMREKIEKEISEEAEWISMTENDFNSLVWLGDDEFEYEGELYDVVQSDSNDKGHYFKVISDKKEKKLKDLVKNSLELAGNSGKKYGGLKQITVSNYIPIQKDEISVEQLCVNFNTEYKLSYNSYIKEENSPPPKMS